MTKKCICIISGRVQGVLFRDFTCRNAKKLNLTGTVENTPDGSVKVIAEGSEENLNRLISKLKKGPLFSHVDNVTVEWAETTNSFLNFKIIYNSFLDRF